MFLAFDQAMLTCEKLNLAVDIGTTRDAGALKVESAAVLKLLYDRVKAE